MKMPLGGGEIYIANIIFPLVLARHLVASLSVLLHQHAYGLMNVPLSLNPPYTTRFHPTHLV